MLKLDPALRLSIADVVRKSVGTVMSLLRWKAVILSQTKAADKTMLTFCVLYTQRQTNVIASAKRKLEES